jgi:GH25 family lysozyme M1 (1,4-beta-N-acetylmuramidase)
MGVSQFVDVSSFQGQIDWPLYVKWAKQWDGVSRVAIKVTEGTGYTDPRFEENRAGAIAAGIDHILYYHFARPDLNFASTEADWMNSVLTSIRLQDAIMLDYEQNAPQSTSEWAYEWLSRMEQLYPGKKIVLYSYDSFIRARLQDSRLTKWPLYLANYTYNPSARPACPAPWKAYDYLQYTDKATIPGIAGVVDADIYLKGDQPMSTIPVGWKDDGTTLTALNGVSVVQGFRSHILNTPDWNPGNVPLTAEFHSNHVLLHNLSVGSGQVQLFRDSLLWWTQAEGVVQEPFLGLELATAYQAIATLQKQSQAQPYIDKLNQIEALAKL